MDTHATTPRRFRGAVVLLLVIAVPVAIFWGALSKSKEPRVERPKLTLSEPTAEPVERRFEPYRPTDTSGFGLVVTHISAWPPDATLEQIATAWRGVGRQFHAQLEGQLRDSTPDKRVQIAMFQASFLNYEGAPDEAYAALTACRAWVESDPVMADKYLYTIIVHQGVSAFRQGETENCVLCRGESSCILPIARAAVHTKPDGSRRAIKHFTEYLDRFPDNLELRWLLNLAHMTLGEHPHGVDPRFLIPLDRFNSPEHSIGKFRDIGHLVGISRFNQAGGAIMDDFDNDGLLDIVMTTMDPTGPMAFYRNKGDGTFEDRTRAAGVLDQLGGLNCVQADYNNDGWLDIYIPRGAWLKTPVRPTLLRNNGNGTFTDVTKEAGLLDPVNSITAQWADYDNDGRLDLFVACEGQRNRLYHNRGDGTFEEVAEKAGVAAEGGTWKGIAWIDYDGDRFPDLFLNNLGGAARLYHNNGDGTFTDVSGEVGVKGPEAGFSCWAFDYDNDGWPDVFATSYDHNLQDVVKGLLGEPHGRHPNKLYRNLGGKKFQDVAKDAGLDLTFATMGSNFGDFDNDGFLDFYLGTGNPQFSMLVPNRMFRNIGGQRFAEITGSSGTGHLQKGHGVACGDWRRCGSLDILIEMGGAVPGDRYHNVLFQNPGQGNNWLNVKLVGKKTNRSAIGARIKAVTAGPNPQTIYRWVSSGSSFGANPLEQHVGLGKADRVAVLEVYWPTSGTTQTFRDLPANQFLEITEFASDYSRREFKPLAIPK